MSSTLLPDSNLPSRRDFLRAIPLAGVALIISSCQSTRETKGNPTNPTLPQPPSPTQTRELETPLSSRSPTLFDTPVSTSTPFHEYDYLPSDASDMTRIILPDSRDTLAMPLNHALQERHSSRIFKSDELPLSFISAILWAGFGINRPDGKRTAPSAFNSQDIDLYLVCQKGLFKYHPADHSLIPLSSADLRQTTGSQAFVESAPMHIILVSDSTRLDASADEALQWSWAHTGLIVQNVYLACAAIGLSTVVRSTLDRTALSSQMGLMSHQHITLAQTIGFPA